MGSNTGGPDFWKEDDVAFYNVRQDGKTEEERQRQKIDGIIDQAKNSVASNRFSNNPSI